MTPLRLLAAFQTAQACLLVRKLTLATISNSSTQNLAFFILATIAYKKFEIKWLYSVYGYTMLCGNETGALPANVNDTQR